MKRSEINAILKDAKAFFADHRFHLPPWAFYSLKDWEKIGPEADEIKRTCLGWDITDFCSGDYAKQGLLLFTVRNGSLKKGAKPYAEKIMIVGVGQETPMHFHFSKMEDIINRGGGRLVLELCNSTKSGDLAKSEVTVSVDGVKRTVPAGGKIILKPGESICLEQGVYHRFWAEKERVLTGEVSMTNDDHADNRFLVPLGRFPKIEEDAKPLHLLVSDYAAFLGKSGKKRS